MNKACLIEALQYDDGENGDGSESATASNVDGSDAEAELGDGAYAADGGDGGWVDVGIATSADGSKSVYDHRIDGKW